LKLLNIVKKNTLISYSKAVNVKLFLAPLIQFEHKNLIYWILSISSEFIY